MPTLLLDEQYIAKRALEGASASCVSKEIGCSRGPVKNVYQRLGFSLRKNNYNLPEIEVIRLYKDEKMCVEDIASKFNCRSFNPVSRILKKNHIQANTDRDYKDTLVNENYFEVIDCEQKAYILGLLAADGCITNKNGHYISLSLIDESLIRQSASILGWTGKIYHKPAGESSFKGKKFFTKDSWKFTIGSKKMVCDLIGHGIGCDKSHNLKMPKLSQELEKHFIRGFFDGDGSVAFCYDSKWWTNGVPNFSIIGLEKILLDIQSILIRDCGISKTALIPEKRVTSVQMSTLHYRGEFALCIRDYMYRDATVWLDRKKDKYYSVDAPIFDFTGYTVESYSKKYGYNQDTIRQWIQKKVLPRYEEWDIKVFSFRVGDNLHEFFQSTIPVSEAAPILDLTEDQAHYLIRRGDIKAITMPRLRKRISKEEVNKLLSIGNYKPKPPSLGHGVNGLSFSNHHKKWQARITYNKKRISLGYFTKKEDAIEIIYRAADISDMSYKALADSFKKEIGGKVLPKGIVMSNNKFQVNIRFSGKNWNLGRFNALESAVELLKRALLLKTNMKSIQELRSNL